MSFQLPQFIEKEARVVGIFTFRQFIFVGTAGAICFIIYFTAPGWVFIVSCIVLGGAALTLAFVKIGGIGLPTIIKNLFGYFITPKVYLWKRKMVRPRVIKEKARPPLRPEEKTPTLKVTERGHLQKLSAQVETRTK